MADKTYTAHWVQKDYQTTAKADVNRKGVVVRKKGEKVSHGSDAVGSLTSGPVWETLDEAMKVCRAHNAKHPEIFQWPVEGRWVEGKGPKGTYRAYVAVRDCWVSGESIPEWARLKMKTVDDLRRG